MLSPAERRTLADIERRLAEDDPGLAGHFSAPPRPTPRHALVAARVLISLLAAAGVVAGVVVARVDVVLVCAAVLVLSELGFRRLAANSR